MQILHQYRSTRFGPIFRVPYCSLACLVMVNKLRFVYNGPSAAGEIFVQYGARTQKEVQSAPRNCLVPPLFSGRLKSVKVKIVVGATTCKQNTPFLCRLIGGIKSHEPISDRLLAE